MSGVRTRGREAFVALPSSGGSTNVLQGEVLGVLGAIGVGAALIGGGVIAYREFNSPENRAARREMARERREQKAEERRARTPQYYGPAESVRQAPFTTGRVVDYEPTGYEPEDLGTALPPRAGESVNPAQRFSREYGGERGQQFYNSPDERGYRSGQAIGQRSHAEAIQRQAAAGKHPHAADEVITLGGPSPQEVAAEAARVASEGEAAKKKLHEGLPTPETTRRAEENRAARDRVMAEREAERDARTGGGHHGGAQAAPSLSELQREAARIKEEEAARAARFEAEHQAEVEAHARAERERNRPRSQRIPSPPEPSPTSVSMGRKGPVPGQARDTTIRTPGRAAPPPRPVVPSKRRAPAPTAAERAKDVGAEIKDIERRLRDQETRVRELQVAEAPEKQLNAAQKELETTQGFLAEAQDELRRLRKQARSEVSPAERADRAEERAREAIRQGKSPEEVKKRIVRSQEAGVQAGPRAAVSASKIQPTAEEGPRHIHLPGAKKQAPEPAARGEHQPRPTGAPGRTAPVGGRVDAAAARKLAEDERRRKEQIEAAEREMDAAEQAFAEFPTDANFERSVAARVKLDRLIGNKRLAALPPARVEIARPGRSVLLDYVMPSPAQFRDVTDAKPDPGLYMRRIEAALQKERQIGFDVVQPGLLGLDVEIFRDNPKDWVRGEVSSWVEAAYNPCFNRIAQTPAVTYPTPHGLQNIIHEGTHGLLHNKDCAVNKNVCAVDPNDTLDRDYAESEAEIVTMAAMAELDQPLEVQVSGSGLYHLTSVGGYTIDWSKVKADMGPEAVARMQWALNWMVTAAQGGDPTGQCPPPPKVPKVHPDFSINETVYDHYLQVGDKPVREAMRDFRDRVVGGASGAGAH